MLIRVSKQQIELNDNLCMVSRKLIRFLCSDYLKADENKTLIFTGKQLGDFLGISKPVVSKYKPQLLRELTSYRMGERAPFEIRHIDNLFRIKADVSRFSNPRSDIIYDYENILYMDCKYSVYLYERGLYEIFSGASFPLELESLAGTVPASLSQMAQRLDKSIKEVNLLTDIKLTLSAGRTQYRINVRRKNEKEMEKVRENRRCRSRK